jgi:hypothetical protein
MSDQTQPAKRPVGRPPKAPDADVTFEVTLPKWHFDYLEFLAVEKRRLGTTPRQAAEFILTRELDALFNDGYHAKEIPAV